MGGQGPEKTVCFQNDFIDKMLEYRDAGPTYPKLVIDEYATITFMEDCEPNDETVVDREPMELPKGYANRRN